MTTKSLIELNDELVKVMEPILNDVLTMRNPANDEIEKLYAILEEINIVAKTEEYFPKLLVKHLFILHTHLETEIRYTKYEEIRRLSAMVSEYINMIIR